MLAKGLAYMADDASIQDAYDEAGRQIDTLRQARTSEDLRASILPTLDSLAGRGKRLFT